MLKQGHLDPIAQDHFQMAFENWQPLSVLGDPHSGSFLMFRGEFLFQFVPMASGPHTGHQWKEPGCVLFAPSLQAFIYIDEIPLSLPF